MMIDNAIRSDSTEALLDSTPMGAVVTALDGGQVLYANGRVADMLGVPQTVLVGAALADLPIRQRHRQRLRQLLADGQGQLAGIAMHLAGRRTLWVDLAVDHFVFHGVPALLWWVNDVTQQIHDAHQLTVAKAMAEASSRAKSEFLTTMGHDIRTPVAGLLERLHHLLGTRLDPQQRAWVDDMRYSADALLALTSDILDMSRLDSGDLGLNPTRFDLHRLVESSMALVRSRAAEKGLSCETVIAAELPRYLEGDADRLRQVLWNLLSNAVKFTESGGVSVHVAGSRHDELWRLRITVVDTGAGIPERMRHRLFHPLPRSARHRAGMPPATAVAPTTGLGLVICKKIVELWGGAIGVDSQPGQGSRFWFEIPCTPERGEAVVLRVLVAEDNPVNQKVIAGLLSRQGHKVTVVGDGRQAVEAVAGGTFDAVLMDMEMPVMGGLEATRAIRALPPPLGGLPIIALTGNSLEGDDERCLAAGMNDYLAKPINPERLFAALRGQIMPAAPCAALPPPMPPLDRIQIAQLEATIGRTSTIELVTMFVADAGLRCAQLAALRRVGEASVDEMRRLAHDLKSTAGNFGFASLSRLAEAIELACREDRRDEALVLVDHLQPRWDEAMAAAHRWLPELPAAPHPSP